MGEGNGIADTMFPALDEAQWRVVQEIAHTCEDIVRPVLVDAMRELDGTAAAGVYEPEVFASMLQASVLYMAVRLVCSPLASRLDMADASRALVPPVCEVMYGETCDRLMALLRAQFPKCWEVYQARKAEGIFDDG